MAKSIFPTEGSIGNFEGIPSRNAREVSMTKWMNLRGKSNMPSFVTSGYTLSSGGSLTVAVAAGQAVIEGYVIDNGASENLGSLTDNATNYIYAQLSKTDNLATDYVLVANTTGTQPANSVLLGTVVIASTVMTFNNILKNRNAIMGVYVGDGSSTQNIALGFTPSKVEVWGTLGTGTSKFKSESSDGSTPGLLLAIVTASSLSSFTFSTSPSLVPVIIENGFQIGDDSGLNKLSQNYYYRAMF